MKKSNASWKLWSGLVLFVLGLLGVYVIFQYFRRPKSEQNQEPEPEPEPEPGNDVDVIVSHYRIISDAANASGYESEEIKRLVTAQAMHETGIFDSQIYDENRNMFGMRQPRVRDTLSAGDKNGYANFKTYEDSAADYFLWAKHVEMPKEIATVDEFISFLAKKGYFEDNVITYKTAVRAHLKTLNSILNAG